MIAWHHKDLQNRMYINIEDGKKISMPRYFKEKIYHETQRKAIGVEARQKQLKKLSESLTKNPNYYADKVISDKNLIRKQGLSMKADKL